MSRERRRRDRRAQRQNQAPRRRNARGHTTYEPAGPIEFPGIMGWLQKRSKIIVLGGIIFLVVSLGAGTLFATNVGQETIEPDDSEPTPTATASATGTAEATATPDEIQRQYDAAPPMTIDPEGSYEAIIHLEGDRDVRVELFPSEAPGFVNNFVFLAENRFFDGLQFHRVLPGFVAQAGDPDGDSTGGPGYWLTDESNSLPLDEGMLAMAKAGAQVSGSQFFITLAPQPLLKDQGFTAFGQVIEGFEHIEGLTPREPVPGSDDQPPPGDTIESIEIIEGDGNAEAPEGSE